MSVIKSFFIAFSIYSKIPVPQFAWKEEDMRYTLCFFPWVGAVIGLCFLLWNRFAGVYGIPSTARAAGWLTDRKLYLLEYQAVVIFF